MPSPNRDLTFHWQDQRLARYMLDPTIRRIFRIITLAILSGRLRGTRDEIESIIDGTLKVKDIGPIRRTQLADALTAVACTLAL